MAIALSIIGLAFAASCVWLTVHIVNRTKKPRWKLWIAAALGAMVLYVLSGAPAETLEIKYGNPDWNVDTPSRMILRPIYAPLAWVLRHSPGPILDWNSAYAEWWSDLILGDESEDPAPSNAESATQS